MQELTFTPSTVAILLVVVALAVLAVRRMVRKGLCDCHSDKGCSGCSGCSAARKGCAAEQSASSNVPNGCPAADRMAARMRNL